MQSAGFIYRHVQSIDMVLDGPEAKARDAVHVIFAAEKLRNDDALPTPDVTESEWDRSFRVVALEALVRMKLTAFRDKDRTHLRDMLELELIDASWLPYLPQQLADRLQQLLDNPEG